MSRSSKYFILGKAGKHHRCFIRQHLQTRFKRCQGPTPNKAWQSTAANSDLIHYSFPTTCATWSEWRLFSSHTLCTPKAETKACVGFVLHGIGFPSLWTRCGRVVAKSFICVARIYLRSLDCCHASHLSEASSFQMLCVQERGAPYDFAHLHIFILLRCHCAGSDRSKAAILSTLLSCSIGSRRPRWKIIFHHNFPCPCHLSRLGWRFKDGEEVFLKLTWPKLASPDSLSWSVWSYDFFLFIPWDLGVSRRTCKFIPCDVSVFR